MKKIEYPDARLLNRERKVRDRAAKEKIRNGTKHLKLIDRDIAPRPEIAGYLNRIIVGDSESVLKKLPDQSVDVIITSPPYNFGLEYKNKSDDARDWSAYFEKLNHIWIECNRILISGGRLIVNIQPLFSDYIPTHHVISNQLCDLDLLWKGEIIWEKNNYNCKYTAWGSWKSPSMPYLKYTWEFIEVFCKGSHKKAGESSNIDITGDEFKKWVYSKWSIAPERNMKRFDHPAMFPEELATRLMKLFSYRGDIILDPFNGAGTTTLAAHKNGRKYIGIDVSKDYCRTARKRIKEIPPAFSD